MSNEVKDWHGKIVGFICRECGGIFESMWGNTCNSCVEIERRHQEILQAITEYGVKP